MSTRSHPLDIATALERRDATHLRGHTVEDYWNMVGQLGGLTNAQLLRAVLDDPQRKGSPVAQTVNFCSAMNKGEFEIECELVRSGKNTQHWTQRMTQGESVIATGSVVTGKRQPRWSHQFAEAPAVPGPPATFAPYSLQGFSNWISRVDFRFLEGEFQPHAPEEKFVASPRSVVWLQHNPPRALDFISLATLADVFFIRIAQVRGYTVPMGTVSLTTYFHASEEELATYGTQHLLGIADAQVFRDTFSDQTSQIWGADGRLLASGTQLAWYRE